MARVKGGDYVGREIADPRVKDALLDYLRASGRLGTMDAETPLWNSHDRTRLHTGDQLTGRARSPSGTSSRCRLIFSVTKLSGGCQRASMNASTVTLACFRIPRNVPMANSPCKGTTHPTAPSGVCFLSMTWLPRCRTCSKPNLSRARIACLPEARRSSGIRRFTDGLVHSRLKGCQEGSTHSW